MQGVYKIENIQNGKVYIGSSKDIERRWKEHIKMLEEGNHHSRKLQNDYNLTKDLIQFKFDVIEEVKFASQLIYREQYWMDYYNAYQNGYNGTKRADCLDKRFRDVLCHLSKVWKNKFQYLFDNYGSNLVLDNICLKILSNEKDNTNNIELINNAILWCISEYGTHDIGIKIEFRKNPFKNRQPDFVVHVYDEKIRKQIFREYVSNMNLTPQNDYKGE